MDRPRLPSGASEMPANGVDGARGGADHRHGAWRRHGLCTSRRHASARMCASASLRHGRRLRSDLGRRGPPRRRRSGERPSGGRGRATAARYRVPGGMPPPCVARREQTFLVAVQRDHQPEEERREQQSGQQSDGPRRARHHGTGSVPGSGHSEGRDLAARPARPSARTAHRPVRWCGTGCFRSRAKCSIGCACPHFAHVRGATRGLRLADRVACARIECACPGT